MEGAFLLKQLESLSKDSGKRTSQSSERPQIQEFSVGTDWKGERKAPIYWHDPLMYRHDGYLCHQPVLMYWK